MKVIARQALTNTVCDKLLNAKATPWEEAQAVAASLRDFPLTWRRNTQIQMHCLWKWLESYNNCTFSTWKDKCLFNLLFWMPNSFSTFHDYGRGGNSLPCLTWRHVTDFLSFRILNNLRLPWKTELALNFFTVLKYFLSFRVCEQIALALKTEFALKVFTVLNILFTFRIFEQLALALKNRVCPEFTELNIYFLSFRIFEQIEIALKNRVCPGNFHSIEYTFYIQDFE